MLVGGTGKKELVTTEYDPAAGVQKIEGVRRQCYARASTPKPRRHFYMAVTMQTEPRALAVAQLCHCGSRSRNAAHGSCAHLWGQP